MKKLFLSVAVATVVLAGLSSCGSKAVTEGKDEGADIKAKIENCTNPDSIRIYAQQAQEYAAKLEAEGRGEEAKAYLDEVIPAVQQKDSTALDVFDLLKQKAIQEVDTAKAKAAEVKEGAVNAANSAVESGKQAVSNAVQDGKNKVDNAVNEGKSKVNNAVQDGKNKVDNAVNNGKEAVGNAAQSAADKVKNLVK